MLSSFFLLRIVFIIFICTPFRFACVGINSRLAPRQECEIGITY